MIDCCRCLPARYLIDPGSIFYGSVSEFFYCSPASTDVTRACAAAVADRRVRHAVHAELLSGLCETFMFVDEQFNVLDAERDQVIRLADRALVTDPIHITDVMPPDPECVLGDYYSNGEYWWPDPTQPDGIPYIRRDGYENPASFKTHRRIMRQMMGASAALTAGYRLTGGRDYAQAALRRLHEFFVAPSTRMNPHLRFAQAVPGRAKGRSFGIIDTRLLIEVPRLVGILQDAPDTTRQTVEGLKRWFARYLMWLRTHPYGRQEAKNPNNHSTCYYVQLSMYSLFVDDGCCLDRCRRWFRRVFLPGQMDISGGFPRELARTRPYSYSVFNLEQMVMLCHLLSTPDENLWSFQLPDGRGVRRGLEFMYEYLDNKTIWPYGDDAEIDSHFPNRMTWMLMAAKAMSDERWAKLWHRLPLVEDEHLATGQHTCRYALLWLDEHESQHR